MAYNRPVRVAIIGLGFGAEFIPIYQHHPDAEMYGISRRNEKELNQIGDQFGIEHRFTSFEQVLEDPDVDQHRRLRQNLSACFGSGKVRDEIRKKSGNRFAVESCQIKIKDRDLAAHIWRFLYDTSRQYRESFDVYGTKKALNGN